jgi:hypothetical protein
MGFEQLTARVLQSGLAFEAIQTGALTREDRSRLSNVVERKKGGLVLNNRQ